MRLAQRNGPQIRIPIRVPTELQPQPELLMVRQQYAFTGSIDEPRRSGEMPGAMRAVVARAAGVEQLEEFSGDLAFAFAAARILDEGRPRRPVFRKLPHCSTISTQPRQHTAVAAARFC